MYSAAPSHGINEESDSLGRLLNHDIDEKRFRTVIHHQHTLFNIYASTSPAPLPAPGLIVTPEIRNQCELYLPLADISAIFNKLYATALTYQPILSSTPFHNSLSWADTFAALPERFQFSPNPARLLESLLSDSDLMKRFLFASFLPERFYGSGERYPGQHKFIKSWLGRRRKSPLRCLNAACGTGEETYRLATILAEIGIQANDLHIEGWTVEPLEVWAAANRRFPNNKHREELLRTTTIALLQHGYGNCVNFSCRDILACNRPTEGRILFDLILCNGLLGGPIIHEKEQLDLAVQILVRVLAPGGILLAADNFHGGWKQQCPQSDLRALMEKYGLKYVDTTDGIGGLKPD